MNTLLILLILTLVSLAALVAVVLYFKTRVTEIPDADIRKDVSAHELAETYRRTHEDYVDLLEALHYEDANPKDDPKGYSPQSWAVIVYQGYSRDLHAQAEAKRKP